MGLLGDDDTQLAIAQGLLSGRGSAGLAAALGNVAGLQDQRLKRQLLQAQIAEVMQQGELRKAQALKEEAAQRRQQEGAAMLQRLMTPAQPQYQPGQLGSGTMGIVDNPQPFAAPVQRPGGLAAATPDQIAALENLYGYKLSDMYKMAQNGVELKPGTFRQDPSTGRREYIADPTKGIGYENGTITRMPGANVLAALAGETAKAQEEAKAGFDPVTIQPQGQPPQMISRGALMRTPDVQGLRVPPAVQAARDAEATQIKTAELEKAKAALKFAIQSGDQSAAARAQGDIAALTRELTGRTASVGMPLASEEEKLRAKTGVEGDAETNKARAKNVQIANTYLSVARRAEDLLGQGPTGSGIGAMYDKAAGFFGANPSGAVVANQLKSLGGWLVSNVPRMEGPQSNFDVANYQVMAADVGNDTLPIKRRIAALNSIKQMMQDVVEGGGTNSGSATGSWDPIGKSSAVSSGGWSAVLRK